MPFAYRIYVFAGNVYKHEATHSINLSVANRFLNTFFFIHRLNARVKPRVFIDNN